MVPLLPLVLLGGGAALLAYSLASKTPSGLPAAAQADLAAQTCDTGPKGEYVFKAALADSLTRGLAGQTYAYVNQTDSTLVTIAPPANGAPVPTSQSAYAWAQAKNATYSILAPMYMATPNNTQRFLRAVAPGQEATYAGPGAQVPYAVLLYAGTLAAGRTAPGVPPGGGSVTPGVVTPGGVTPPAPAQPVTPVAPGGVAPGPNVADLPVVLQGPVQDLIMNGRDPNALEIVAQAFDTDGYTGVSAAIRQAEANLRAQPPQPVQPVGPQPPPPSPTPPPAPQAGIPALVLQQLGANTQVDTLLQPSVAYGGDGSPATAAMVPAGTTVYVGNYFQTQNAVLGWLAYVMYQNADGSLSDSNIYFPTVVLQKGSQMAAPGQAPTPPNPAPAQPGSWQTMTVTTATDPLAMHNSVDPNSATTMLVPKGATVQMDTTQQNVQGPDNMTWCVIQYTDPQNGTQATGWVHQQYLTLQPGNVTTSGTGAKVIVGATAAPGRYRTAKVMAPAGIRLRTQPQAQTTTVTCAPAGALIVLISQTPGPKMEAQSPSQGGWSFCCYKGQCGWCPSEWLQVQPAVVTGAIPAEFRSAPNKLRRRGPAGVPQNVKWLA